MDDVTAKIRRPRYSARTVFYWVQRVANEISAAHGGRVPDTILVEAQMRRELDADPDRYMNRDAFVRHSRKYWDRESHRIQMKCEASLFVPGLYVNVGKRARVPMANMIPTTDLLAWAKIDQEAAVNFMRAIDKRDTYRRARLVEAAANPDCLTLGDIEAKLHGFKPSADDATPSFAGVPPDDDEEDLSP